MAYTLECRRCTQSGAIVVRIPTPRPALNRRTLNPNPVNRVDVRCSSCGHRWASTQAAMLAGVNDGSISEGDRLDIYGRRAGRRA